MPMGDIMSMGHIMSMGQNMTSSNHWQFEISNDVTKPDKVIELQWSF